MRDGGVRGVVIRLGRGFNEIKVEGNRVRAGTAAPDLRVAKAAQEAGIAGLAFLRGIPGAIGGALRMNGGAYGRETKDILIEARGVDRAGNVRIYTNAEMGFTYRHCGVPDDVIFTEALFEGAPGDPAAIAAEMDKITRSARDDAAGEEPHRRLDVQESARAQGLATDRCRGLPRPRGRRRAGVGIALQLPDQPRQCDRGGYREVWVKRCARRVKENSGVDARVGDQADR